MSPSIEMLRKSSSDETVFCADDMMQQQYTGPATRPAIYELQPRCVVRSDDFKRSTCLELELGT